MSVLKHEGTVPILFGSTAVTVGTITRNGYLARPDLAGRFPTVIVVPGVRGLTSSVKDLCRRLARWGLAAVAADPYRGNPPGDDDTPVEDEAAFRAISDGRVVGEVRAFARFVTNPAGFWSNAEDGFGLLGLDAGGRVAALAAARPDGAPGALALLSAPLRAGEGDDRPYPLDLVPGLGVPTLGLSGKDDDRVPAHDVEAIRAADPAIEWALYPGVGHGFYDDSAAGFDAAAARDAIERLAAFFERHLPAAG